MNLQQMLERDEGRRSVAYKDTLGNVTIGTGHLAPELQVGTVWTDEQIDAAFDLDVTRATEQCRANFPWFDGLNDPRQAVIVAMCFQMGISRLLGFTHTLAAVGRGDYQAAADGMRASVWAHQTPLRALRMAEQMQEGQWVTT